jgi:hypothetical protein
MSFVVSPYDCDVAAAMPLQFLPFPSHRYHWYPNEVGWFLQEPLVVVRV